MTIPGLWSGEALSSMSPSHWVHDLTTNAASQGLYYLGVNELEENMHISATKTDGSPHSK